MCYFSTTLKAGTFRDAKVGEEMTLVADRGNHHTYTVADSDRMITCVRNRSEVHIANFQVKWDMVAHSGRHIYDPLTSRAVPKAEIMALIGKPVKGVFKQRDGQASDWIEIEGFNFHLTHLKAGTKLYTGPEKVSLETRLGMNDPSLVNDHRFVDDHPVQNAINRIVNFCSITR